MLEINNQYDFFKNVKVTDDGYLQVSVVGGGGGGGTGGTFAFLATNYTDLLTKTGMVTGDIAYVYNSQGAKWLPGKMGGTYYPGGMYIYSASTWTSDRNSISFQLEQDTLSLATKANLSGATFSGPIDSTSTILSGGTDLYSIFATSASSGDITRVQPGTNINTGGTANNPIINLDNNVSLTSLSATTIYSGGTDLSSVFAPIGVSGDITRVQPGTNIFTGGTANNPTVNITDASLNTLNVSGTTILAHASATTLALLNNATATTEFSDYNFNTIEANCSLSNIIGGSRNRIIGGSENIQIIGGYSITGSSSATTYVSNLVATGTTDGNIYATNIFSGDTNLGDMFAKKTMTVPYEFVVACSDETTPLTTGSNKVKFISPIAFTLTGVTGSLSTVGSTSTAVDVNLTGGSIFSTTLTIDAGELTSVTADVPPVISTSAIGQYAQIAVDIDTAGTSAAGLKLIFAGTRTITVT